MNGHDLDDLPGWLFWPVTILVIWTVLMLIAQIIRVSI